MGKEIRWVAVEIIEASKWNLLAKSKRGFFQKKRLVVSGEDRRIGKNSQGERRNSWRVGEIKTRA